VEVSEYFPAKESVGIAMFRDSQRYQKHCSEGLTGIFDIFLRGFSEYFVLKVFRDCQIQQFSKTIKDSNLAAYRSVEVSEYFPAKESVGIAMFSDSQKYRKHYPERLTGMFDISLRGFSEYFFLRVFKDCQI
jgi:hypothetical protein